MSRNIVKPKPVSGFAEYTPEVQRVAQGYLDKIRAIFELHGFTGIETPIIERLEVLLSKGGDTDKEMYVLQRYQAEESADAQFGLRYDLTIPFARYVAAHFNNLSFPFKRYQIQNCWRGERPQEGRYRQFRQCDVDVVALDSLPLYFDAEIPTIVKAVLDALGLDAIDFCISNRNVLQAYMEALGVSDIQSVTRILDKLDKVGEASVITMLEEEGLDSLVIDKLLAIGRIKTKDLSFVEKVKELGVTSDLLDQGLKDLEFVAQHCFAYGAEEFTVDLSITRGFDYYTGTVYEVRWKDYPELGSIAGGGRYDDLAGSYINKSLPGVGMSVGFTRIFGKLLKEGKLNLAPHAPTKVLVGRLDSDSPTVALELVAALRDRGISSEVYWSPGDKLKKQLQYADRKGIEYFVFDTDMLIKNMQTGEQITFDKDSWCPE